MPQNIYFCNLTESLIKRLARNVLFLVFFLFALPFANEHLAAGDAFFSKRAEGAYNNMAKAANIDDAIKNYTLALKDTAVREEAAWKLLRAYYFFGCFSMPKSKEKKKHFEKAKNEGKDFFREFPKNTEIAYWYSVCLALWVRELNSIKIVLNMSVINETRRVANFLIKSEKNDDKVSAARGYQLLGGLHKKLPKIVPSVSKDSIEFYLKKSMQLNQSDLSTILMLAEYYKEDKKDAEKTKALLLPVLNRKPRAGELLEDERNFIKMRKLLE